MENPYQTPQSKLSSKIPVHNYSSDDVALATRGSRLGASFIDGLILMVFAIPLMFLLGIWDYTSSGQQAPWTLQVLATVINWVIFFGLHGWLLKKNGQTLGKKAVGIRIATLDGDVPPLGKLILLRYIIIGAVSSIPLVGPLIGLLNILFIFRTDRRCIHDLIAGTQVVQSAPGM